MHAYIYSLLFLLSTTPIEILLSPLSAVHSHINTYIVEKKLQEKDTIVADLHAKVLSEITKRASDQEDFENDNEMLKRDKEHAGVSTFFSFISFPIYHHPLDTYLTTDKTMKKMETMLEEANKLYQEMERQCEEAQSRLKTLESSHTRVVAERDELDSELKQERNNSRTANTRCVLWLVLLLNSNFLIGNKIYVKNCKHQKHSL